MKKVAGIVSLLMVAGVISSCFADTYQEGKTALAQHNYSKAMEAFTKACDSGNFKGCFQLGALYENGEGVGKNTYTAATLYTQACRGGEPLGCSNMGLKYDTP